MLMKKRIRETKIHVIESVDNRFFLVTSLATRKDTQVIRIEPFTGKLQYHAALGTDLFPSEEIAYSHLEREITIKRKRTYHHIIGYFTMGSFAFLMLVKKSTPTLVIPPYHEVKKIQETEWITIKLLYRTNLDPQERKSLQTLKKHTLDDLHYYCETYDLSHPYPSPYSVYQYDKEFVFNDFLSFEFDRVGLRKWVCVLIQGFIEEQPITNKVKLTMIAKKSSFNPGTRYNARGLNDSKSAPGNEWEVELLIWVRDRDVCKWSSVVWRRGTVPIHWKSVMPLGGVAPSDAVIVIDKKPYRNIDRYYKRLLKQYHHPQISCVNLLRYRHEKENLLTKHYEESLQLLKKQISLQVSMFHFDWLFEHKNENQEGDAVRKLWDMVGPKIRDYNINSGVIGLKKKKKKKETLGGADSFEGGHWGREPKQQREEGEGEVDEEDEDEEERSAYLVDVIDLQICESQGGIFRFNCADSLDRTNMCTFYVALQWIGQLCRRVGVDFCKTLRETRDWSTLDLSLKSIEEAYDPRLLYAMARVFLALGDVAAKLFTGSKAMHANALRKYFPQEDQQKSESNIKIIVERRIENVVRDNTRQKQLEMFVGIKWDEYFTQHVSRNFLGSTKLVSTSPTYIINNVPSFVTFRYKSDWERRRMVGNQPVSLELDEIDEEMMDGRDTKSLSGLSSLSSANAIDAPIPAVRPSLSKLSSRFLKTDNSPFVKPEQMLLEENGQEHVESPIWYCRPENDFVEMSLFLPYFCRVMELSMTIRHGISKESSPYKINVFVGTHLDDSILVFQDLQIPRCEDKTKLTYIFPPYVSGVKEKNELYDFEGVSCNASSKIRVVKIYFHRLSSDIPLSLGTVQIFGMQYSEKIPKQLVFDVQKRIDRLRKISLSFKRKALDNLTARFEKKIEEREKSKKLSGGEESKEEEEEASGEEDQKEKEEEEEGEEEEEEEEEGEIKKLEITIEDEGGKKRNIEEEEGEIKKGGSMDLKQPSIRSIMEKSKKEKKGRHTFQTQMKPVVKKKSLLNFTIGTPPSQHGRSYSFVDRRTRSRNRNRKTPLDSYGESILDDGKRSTSSAIHEYSHPPVNPSSSSSKFSISSISQAPDLTSLATFSTPPNFLRKRSALPSIRVIPDLTNDTVKTPFSREIIKKTGKYQDYIRTVCKNGTNLTFMTTLRLEYARVRMSISSSLRNQILTKLGFQIREFNPNSYVYYHDDKVEKSLRKDLRRKKCKNCQKRLFFASSQCRYCRHTFCKSCMSEVKHEIIEFKWTRDKYPVCVRCAMQIIKQKEIIPQLQNTKEFKTSNDVYEQLFKATKPFTQYRAGQIDQVQGREPIQLLSQFPFSGILFSVATEERNSSPIETVLFPIGIYDSHFWQAPTKTRKVTVPIVLPYFSQITRICLITDPWGYRPGIDIPKIEVSLYERYPIKMTSWKWDIDPERRYGAREEVECQNVPEDVVGMRCRIVQFTFSLEHIPANLDIEKGGEKDVEASKNEDGEISPVRKRTESSQQKRNRIHVGRLLVFGRRVLGDSLVKQKGNNIAIHRMEEKKKYIKMQRKAPNVNRIQIRTNEFFFKENHILDHILSPQPSGEKGSGGTAVLPVSGFRMEIRHHPQEGVASQVRRVRVHVLRSNKKDDLVEQEFVNVFQIPKVRTGTSLYFDFYKNYSNAYAIRFEFVSTYGSREFISFGKIYLYTISK